MSKSRNYDREIDITDRLKKDNTQLKKENSRLRKENDRLKNLRSLVSKQSLEDAKPKKQKRDWTCFTCGKGTMKLILFPRRDGNFYLRRCSLEECGHQTKLKKFTEDVEES